MDRWYLCLQLLLLIASELRVECFNEEIDPDQIKMKITGSERVLTVSWTAPDETVDLRCYKTELQVKSSCVKDWERAQIHILDQTEDSEVYTFNLTTFNMKKNYEFRIRMKLMCLMDGEWSAWTRVERWGNNEGSCMELSSPYRWVFIFVTVLPMTVVLIVCLLTQECIRRIILPVIPDPKHLKDKITDIDQTQWWDCAQHNEDCKTTDVEIINKSERLAVVVSDRDELTLADQLMDTTSEQHDSLCAVCTSETPGEITEPQYSERVMGYIAL